MTSVRILPEILSNKIAAGEVVERPSSVVKELVENAIDAQADRIFIDIEAGGRSLIRVSDNGSGMGKDDALLAIERYATSKIASESDLFDIKSLGFRGEALPSIAAVSRLTMITKDDKSDAATEIRVDGGKIKSVNRVGAPRGTMVSVAQLFFNTPARRKFLKTVSTEFGHIAETVACIALCRPALRFRLTHNGKIVKDWQNVQNPAVRMSDVLGDNADGLLYSIDENAGSASISGWICDPSVTRSTPAKIYIFVNGRFIRDRGLQRAFIDAFRGRLMRGRFPMGALYLSLPAKEVDVNVHPAKHEVRFFRQQEIYLAVKSAVANAMDKKAEKAVQPKAGSFAETEKPATNRPPYQSGSTFTVSEASNSFDTVHAKPRQPFLFTQTALPDATLIGQFNNTYILCEKDDDLLLIDQHAAHERIVYEQLSGRAASGFGISVQKLLVPETIELTHRESAALEQLLPELNRTGLEIELFGENTFIVKAVPEMLAEKQIQPVIVEIAEIADHSGYRQGMDRAVDECIITMACHGAIRANQSLTEQQMKAVIQQLEACGNPYTCPHGRPTMISWDTAFLEKQFKRSS